MSFIGFRGPVVDLSFFRFSAFKFFLISIDKFTLPPTVPAPTSNARSRCAFTLVEILVVIVIISILLVTVIPALQSLSASNGSKASVSQFMNVVEQARTLAITSGNATYIVFADSTVSSADYRSKAFVIFQDRNFIPTAVSKWYILRTGISLEPNNGLLVPPDPPNQINFVCPVIGAAKLPYLKFDPSGMVTIPDAPDKLFVRFFSGSVDSAGQSTFTDNTQKTTGKLDQVTISQFTGRTKYVDPYSPS